VAENVTDFEAFTHSKIIAYETAVNFVKERKPSFDLVHILPGFMQGASELHETVDDMLNDFNRATIDTALGNILNCPKMTAQVLLKDVAGMHLFALNPKVVHNLENLVVVANDGHGIPWDSMALITKRCYPKEVEAGILRPIRGQKDLMMHFEVRSTQKALGAGFSDAVWIVRSVIDQYLQLRGSSISPDNAARSSAPSPEVK